jgi:ribosomal protein S9
MSDIKIPKATAPQHLGTGRRKSAVARVRLRRATPLVKEMLLANPNRIVLDD